jgi:hypothetical protein
MNIIFLTEETGGDISVYLDRETTLKEGKVVKGRDGRYIFKGYLPIDRSKN